MSDLQSRLGPKLEKRFPNKVWVRPGLETTKSPKERVNRWNKRKRSREYDSDISSHEDPLEGQKKSLSARLGMDEGEDDTEPPPGSKSLLERMEEPIDVSASTDSFFAHHTLSLPPSPTSSVENEYESSPRPTEESNQILSMESSHEPPGSDVDRESQLMVKHNKQSFCAPMSRSTPRDQNRSTIETAQTTRTGPTTGTPTEQIPNEKRFHHTFNDKPRTTSIPLLEPSTEPLVSGAKPLRPSPSQQSLSEGEVSSDNMVSQPSPSIEDGEVRAEPPPVAKVRDLIIPLVLQNAAHRFNDTERRSSSQPPSVNPSFISDSVLSAFAQKATKEIGKDLRARICPPPPPPTSVSDPGPTSRTSPPNHVSGSQPFAGPSSHSPVIPPSAASISGRGRVHTRTVPDTQAMTSTANGPIISAFDSQFNRPNIRYTPSPPHTDDESTPRPQEPLSSSKSAQHDIPRPRTPHSNRSPKNNENSSWLRSQYRRERTSTGENSSRRESHHPEQSSPRENMPRRDSFVYEQQQQQQPHQYHQQHSSPVLHPMAAMTCSPALQKSPRTGHAPPTEPAALRNRKLTPRKSWNDRMGVGKQGSHSRRLSDDSHFGVDRSPRVHSPLRSPARSPVPMTVRSPVRSPVHSPVRSTVKSSSAHPRRPRRIVVKGEEENGDIHRERGESEERRHRHRRYPYDGREETWYRERERERHDERRSASPSRKAYMPHTPGRLRSRSRSRSHSRSRSLSRRAENALSPRNRNYTDMSARSRSRSLLDRFGAESSSMSISNASSTEVGSGTRVQERRRPLFWKAKAGLEELGLLKWNFDIDQETAIKLELKTRQDDDNVNSPSVLSNRKRKISLRLACFSRDKVDSCIDVLDNGQQLTSETSPAIHYWPTQGHLIVKVNEEQQDTRGKTWLPDKLGPQDPPISLENVIYEGDNSLELVQLSNMADKVFLLFAQERPHMLDAEADFAPLANTLAVTGPITIMPAYIMTAPLLD